MITTLRSGAASRGLGEVSDPVLPQYSLLTKSLACSALQASIMSDRATGPGGPKYLVDASSPNHSDRLIGQQSNCGTNFCLLLVGDDLEERHRLRQALRGEGYSVVEADHGDDALKEFSRAPVDAGILDLTIRRPNRWDTLERLHTIAPNLPLIVLSPHLDDYTKTRALESHFPTAVLEKPFGLPLLLTTLEHVTRHTAPGGQNLRQDRRILER